MLGAMAQAEVYSGVISFADEPVPGAMVVIHQGGKSFTAVTDQQGFYSVSGLADGPAEVAVEMTGFARLEKHVTVEAATVAPVLDKMNLLMPPLGTLMAELKPQVSAPHSEKQEASELKSTGRRPKEQSAAMVSEEGATKNAAASLLIDGSVNNAATSSFALAPHLGNSVSGKSMYTFVAEIQAETSALDAKSYSITGEDVPKPQTREIVGGFAMQGPIRIPGILQHGPNLFVGYQRFEDSEAVTTPGLVPTVLERRGDLSGLVDALGHPVAILDPSTGQPYIGNHVPVSPQAQALLALYPLPNFTGNTVYNYEAPLVTDTHSDTVNSYLSKTIGLRNEFSGSLAVTSTRVSNTTLMGFLDRTALLGMNATTAWEHAFSPRVRTDLNYGYNRQSTRTTPFWQDRANLSGEAGITGNDQDPAYWGPPTLNFSSGISSLSDVQSSFDRNQTDSVSLALHWTHYDHNVIAGGDFRRQEFNYIRQENPRGTFTFTGAATAPSGTSSSGATGSDLADFLIGVPDASALNFGNADKYLRQSVTDLFVTDDWRVDSQLTLNLGARWEYGAPVTEVKDRLVNLDVAGQYATIAPVLASDPKGTLTGESFPRSLIRPDRHGFEPRLGMSWRPVPASSLLVRGGYGIYYDTSVYPGIALLMAEQAPLATSLTLENSAVCPLTLAAGFLPCSTTTAETFGVDPNFRVGWLETWNLEVQRDLPGSMQMLLSYQGNHGLNGVQEFLPNTNPPGMANVYPVGFSYMTSTGHSTREAGQAELRRRLKDGFTATVTYTYSKSLDDDSSLGGKGAAVASSAILAQDWRNLSAEWGLSTFDQRNVLNVLARYTTGMGMHGGTLVRGWRGKLYQEWTVQAQMTAASGLPETPIDAAATVAGYASFVRPDLTGTSGNQDIGPRHLNPAAFVAPASGMWGNAGRNSLRGPGQLTLDAAMLRTFRMPHHITLDLKIDALNVMNHVAYTSWVANINSTQFGLPTSANPMRRVQTSMRLRF
jgi:hypothetical protein